MTWRWLLATSAGLLIFALSPMAFAVDKLAAELASNNDQLKTELAQMSPMFRCFVIGRNQGLADRLALDIQRSEKRQTVNPKLREFHSGLQKNLITWIDMLGCDPQAQARLKRANQSSTLVPHLRLATAETQTLSAQDGVIQCFYVGRLSLLVDRFKEDLTQIKRKGGKIPAAAAKAYSQAKRLVSNQLKHCT